MPSFQILSVNVSEQKGIPKHSVSEIHLTPDGIESDAHAGSWHRQVSLLAIESIQKFEEQCGKKFRFGDFAENMTTQGFLLYTAKPGDRLRCGQIELEVTQIGKKCHGTGCAVYHHTGACVMPKEGIFARVLRGGKLQAGAIFEFVPKSYQFDIITLSTRAYQGIYADLSGPETARLLQTFCDEKGWPCNIGYHLIPDDATLLHALLTKLIHQQSDFIFTTGGTGVGPTDITPETVKPLLQREIPGIMEEIRRKYSAANPAALLSRSIAGQSGNSLIFTLPGSVKAVREYTSEICVHLEHLAYMRMGLGH
ncbi:MAG: molybdopterin-binding protein [Bacteroidetes bacterium]|nr:molybdopterin-binding protein [Bacteroidota bacterium]